jgi:predicted DNA-binding transcriptional regulator YafY
MLALKIDILDTPVKTKKWNIEFIESLLTAWCQHVCSEGKLWRNILRKADRLLKVIQILRRRKKPTPARLIAEELEVAPRTIYRDIVDLQASHVPIEGEPGIGYVLRKGYDLPPLMFDAQELEVMVLGARMVADRGDPMLAKAAEDVLVKISAVLPVRLSKEMWRTALLIPHRSKSSHTFGQHLPTIRKAVREHCKLQLDYSDGNEHKSTRIVWPLGLYFYSHVTILCAWCELREGFRAFRSDRIRMCKIETEKFDPKNGAVLEAFMQDWQMDVANAHAK